MDMIKVESKFFTCCEPPNELVLKSGEKFGPITLAYETYGQLNEDKSNAILVCHALSGDAHAAGLHEGDSKPGWWDIMIGPEKAFDTDKYFVICSNVLGSCKGSTGPNTINPETGKPYGLSFPVVTIRDMVNAQKLLIDHLGIKKLLSVAGGSMGGLQVLKWSVHYPESIKSAVVIATNYRHNAQQIALNEVGRQAIMADPDWQKGDYYGKSIPARGLALARMIGHITYMSDKSMEEKFGRQLKDKEKVGYDFSIDLSKAYNDGHKLLGNGIYGMIGGDGFTDGNINSIDKTNIWKNQACEEGYKEGDFNLNKQVSNPDKNKIWKPNLNSSTQLPD